MVCLTITASFDSADKQSTRLAISMGLWDISCESYACDGICLEEDFVALSY